MHHTNYSTLSLFVFPFPFPFPEDGGSAPTPSPPSPSSSPNPSPTPIMTIRNSCDSSMSTPSFRWNEDSGVNGRLCEFIHTVVHAMLHRECLFGETGLRVHHAVCRGLHFGERSGGLESTTHAVSWCMFLRDICRRYSSTYSSRLLPSRLAWFGECFSCVSGSVRGKYCCISVPGVRSAKEMP